MGRHQLGESSQTQTRKLIRSLVATVLIHVCVISIINDFFFLLFFFCCFMQSFLRSFLFNVFHQQYCLVLITALVTEKKPIAIVWHWVVPFRKILLGTMTYTDISFSNQFYKRNCIHICKSINSLKYRKPQIVKAKLECKLTANNRNRYRLILKYE